MTKNSKKDFINPREMVLAKMYGFPPWPSFVMPQNMIPNAVNRVKKKSTNYCVIFIPDGDYYWVNDKSLEKLTPEKLGKRLEKLPKHKFKKKSQVKTMNVTDALLAARDLDFDIFMDQLQGKQLDDQVYGQEDYDNDGNQDDNQELAGERSDENEVKEEEKFNELQGKINNTRSKGMKRIKAADFDHARKNMKKSDVNAVDSSDSKKSYRKYIEKTASQEEQQLQLWLCRIKLQRSLIQRNQPVTPADRKQYPPPSGKELQIARLILNRLNDYTVTLEMLRNTKIHKVLKCILKVDDLEYPDSFKLHEKCRFLLAKWAPLLESLKDEKSQKASGDDAPRTTHSNSNNLEDSDVSAFESTTDSYRKVEGEATESDTTLSNGKPLET